MESISDADITRLLQEMASTPIIDGVIYIPREDQLIFPQNSLRPQSKNSDGYNNIYLQVSFDFTFALEIPIRGSFSLFIEKHRMIASKLIKQLMDCKDRRILYFTLYCICNKINPDLFYYCLMVVISHRKDTRNTIQSNPFSSLISKFITEDAYRKLTSARNAVCLQPGVVMKAELPMCEISDDTFGNNGDEEARINYFREDRAINLHHFHWHTIYVATDPSHIDRTTPSTIVDKDRRGELFYYMHHQLVARYDAERLCNRLPRVKQFNSFDKKIREGYYPNRINTSTGKSYPGRPSGMFWKDIQRPGNTVRITELTEYVSRVIQAIDDGSVKKDKKILLKSGSFLCKREDLTIDTLGNVVERSDLSPHREHYGDFHTNGHMLTAWIHDPENTHNESNGVMGDFATAVMDPFFYRWHKYIDWIFDRFKSSKMCPKYGEQLKNSNVKSISIDVELDANHLKTLMKKNKIKFVNVRDLKDRKKNELKTYMDYTNVPINGLDKVNLNNCSIEIKHLNYWPFTYDICIENVPSYPTTIRIFLAPKFDSRGDKFKLNEQRELFIELDSFEYNLFEKSMELLRDSVESSVTIPWEQTFPKSGYEFKSNHCSCGWPQHMLFPRGSECGDTYQLFVMASKDYLSECAKIPTKSANCQTSTSFCGLVDQKYPDCMDMGFPFDRPFDDKFVYIENLVAEYPNMCVRDIIIKHIKTEKNNKSVSI